MNFSNFPSDLLRHTFSFFEDSVKTLELLQSVCKNWKQISSNESIQNFSGIETVSLNSVKFFWNTQNLFGLRTETVIIDNKIESDYDEKEENSTYIQIAKTCPNMKCFWIEHNYFNDDAIIEITERCPLISKIKISGCQNFTDVSLYTLSRKNLKYVWFDFDLDVQVTDKGLTYFFENCSNIENLVYMVFSMDNNTNVSVSKISCLKNLVSLYVWSNEIDDTTLGEIVQGCPKLESLTIKSYSLTNNCVPEIVKRCPNLIHFDVEVSYTHDSYTLIANSYPNIEFFNFGKGITDISLQYILKKCTKMKKIDLISFNDEESKFSNETLKEISNCSELVELLILKFSFDMSDDTFCQIIQKCKKLRILFIKNFDFSTQTLKKISNCPSLETLEIINVDKFDEECLIFILNNCKKLKKILFNNFDVSSELKNIYPNVNIEIPKNFYYDDEYTVYNNAIREIPNTRRRHRNRKQRHQRRRQRLRRRH